MNAYMYSLLALDIARERSREAEARWIASHVRLDRPGLIRRGAARSMIAVSHGAALVARRLDHRVADDQVGRLAPAR